MDADDDATSKLDAHIASGEEFIVHFTATWCGPCKRVEPHIHAHVDATGVRYVCIDIDQHETTAGAFGIRSVPTFVRCKGDVHLSEFSGADEARFRALCDLVAASHTPDAGTESIVVADVPRA
jgi:thioredoxin-like negative regulator of GroEL